MVIDTISSLNMSAMATTNTRLSSMVVPTMMSTSAAEPDASASMGRSGRAAVPNVGWNGIAEPAGRASSSARDEPRTK